MAIFGHELEQHKRIGAEGIEVLDITLDYYDAFGQSRKRHITLATRHVDRVTVSGTASNTVVVKKGRVISKLDFAVLVLTEAQVVECCYLKDEELVFGDEVFVAEHVSHRDGSYGELDLIASKQQGAFNIHSINLMCYNKKDEYVGVVHIDALSGQVNIDELDTSRK